MPPKRSNKTARVLNLIAKPDDESSEFQKSNNNITEQSTNGVSQTQSSNAVLSDDEISKLIAQQQAQTPEPQPEKPANAVLSDDEISKLIAQQQAQTPEPQPEKPANAVLSDDEISKLIAQQQAETPEPQPEKPANAVLSDDEISKLIAQQQAETPEPQPEKPEIPTEPENIQSSNESESNAESPQPTQLPPIPQPVVPILQTVRDNEQQLENQICSDLLSSLELEEANEMESNKLESQAKPVESSDNISVQAYTEDKSHEQSNFIPTAPKGSREVTYINVIQELVEDEAIYSSKMLNCHCPRCVADMKALTLTNLPSKYVVVEDSQKRGLMRIYSSKYSRIISVQMMKSCVIVNENPHH